MTQVTADEICETIDRALKKIETSLYRRLPGSSEGEIEGPPHGFA